MARMWVAPKIAGATSGMLGFVMKMASLYKEGDGDLIMSVGAGMMLFTVLVMGGIMRIRINRVQSKDSSMSTGSDVESDHQSAPHNNHHHHDVDIDGSRGTIKVCKSMKKLSDDDQYSSNTSTDDDGLQKEDQRRHGNSSAHNMISCCIPCMSSYVHMKKYLSLSSSKKRLLGPASNSDAEKTMNMMEEGGHRRPELSVVAAPEIKLGGADRIIRSDRSTVMQVDSKEINGDIDLQDSDDGLLWQRSIMLGERCEPPAFSGVILYDEHGNLVPEFPCKSPAHRRSINNLINNNDHIRDATTATLHDKNNRTGLMTPTSSPGAAAGFSSSPSSFSLRQLMTSH